MALLQTSTSGTDTAAAKRRRPSALEQEIINYISQFAQLSEVEIRGIIDSMNVRIFKKGTVLLKEGQFAKLCYFVLKGCVRQYYVVDGEEKTTEFYTEGQPVTPYEGNHKRTAAKYFLICEEDCIMTSGTPEDEKKLFAQFPHFEAITRVAVEEELGKTQEKLANFLLKSPEERYLHLMETRPDLLDRVPQYQLASYLGIKPESLSRIRKRIMKK